MNAVAGEQGVQGYQGEQGFQGFQGNESTVAGPQGFQGDTGAQGFQGDSGSQGSQGDSGSQGSQGNQGFQGDTGAQGFQGDSGAQGSQGNQGNQGFQGAGGLTTTNADTLDGINSTSFARVDSTSTFTVATYFESNLGTTSGSLNSPPLQAFATGTNAAFMSFHRANQYAVNFGLDSDNVLRIGGWSASANRWQLDMSGNMTVAGDVNSNSDIKLKTNIQTLTNSLEKVLNLRGVEFDRIDLEEKHQIGFIAQEVELIVPELVSESQGTKSVAYGNISALLVEAIKEQQDQINTLKQEIENLKKNH